MRRFLLLGSILFASCSGSEKLTVEPAQLPAGTERFEIGELPLASISVIWSLRIRSQHDIGLHLSARLEGNAPPGASVRLEGDVELLPRATGKLLLVFGTPRVPGAYDGRIVIECKELPGWKREFTYSGSMVDKPVDGPVLQLTPAGVDLGEVRRGEQKSFSVTVANVGNEAFTILEWQVADPDRIFLRNARPGEVIAPGTEFQLTGVCATPFEAGRFESNVRLQTSMASSPARDLRIGGRVVVDFECIPERLELGRVHAPDHPLVALKVRARETAEPFTVAEVEGAEPYFDVESPGAPEPAREQTIQLRVKADAPLGSTSGQRLRLRLGPSGEVVECRISMIIIPSIVAQPDRLEFGRVSAALPPTQEITLWHHANRPFRVTNARARSNLFIVEVKQPPALPPRLLVTIPHGAPAGILRDVIEIETDDARTPGIHVPVTAQVTP